MKTKIEITESEYKRFKFLENLFDSHKQFGTYVEQLTRRKGSKVVAVDFDGTIVRHAYPEIGETVPLAIEGLLAFQQKEWKIILNTMRSGERLQHAVDYLEARGVSLYGVNLNPTQRHWTESTKCYAPLYIDDAALGCPLIYPAGDRPFVDWLAIHYLMGWAVE
jgi:hypothetical protein